VGLDGAYPVTEEAKLIAKTNLLRREVTVGEEGKEWTVPLTIFQTGPIGFTWGKETERATRPRQIKGGTEKGLRGFERKKLSQEICGKKKKCISARTVRTGECGGVVPIFYQAL